MKLNIDYTNLQPVSFLLAGVGGQGTILASDILAEIGLRMGYDVKKAEIHGMSQRGGSVVSNLRWAKQVYSPIVPKGCADILIAFEKVEAARFCEYLRPGGVIIVNDYAIPPVTVTSGTAHYPSDDEIRATLARVAQGQYWVDGIGLAETLQNTKTANVVLIGALARVMGVPAAVAADAIASRVPGKYLDVNQKAFEVGAASIGIPI